MRHVLVVFSWLVILAGSGTAQVSGIVVDQHGDALGGVRVSLLQGETTVDDRITDGTGSFEFGAARGHGLRLEARLDGFANASIGAHPLLSEFTIRMQRGYLVEGIVELPNGEPARDCTVTLEPLTVEAQAFSTTTGRDDRRNPGYFSIDRIPAGPARLTARDYRYQPITLGSIQVGSPGLHHLRFTSAPALELRGRVFGVDGSGTRALKDAVVLARPGTLGSEHVTPIDRLTDGNGEFTLQGLGPGLLHVEVVHPDYSRRSRVVRVRPSNTELVFELVQRSRVRGRLTGASAAAGTVLEIALRDAGVSVQGLLGFGGSGERHYTTVGEDGVFEFPTELSAGAAQLALVNGELCFAQSGSRWLTVQIEDDGDTELELPTALPSVAAGRVIDEAGNPIAGAEVLWQQSVVGTPAPLALMAVSDDEGRYSVRGLPRPIGFGLLDSTRLVLRRPSFATAEIEFPGAGAGETVEVPTVTLVPAGSISGRVSRGGEGVEGAIVFIGRLGDSQRDVTGADGSFTLRDLSPGEYRVNVSYAMMQAVASEEAVKVSAGGAAGPVEIRLPAAVSGRVVVAPGGPPLGDVRIVGRSGTTISAADGTFVLPAGETEILVIADDAQRVRKRVTVPATDEVFEVVMPLVDRGTVTARLLTLPENRPCAGAILRIEPVDGPLDDPILQAQRGDPGTWVSMSGGELRLVRFPVGRSRLTLQSPGFAPVVREFLLDEDEEVSLGDLFVEPGARVRGRVIAADGQPVAGARVFLGDELDMVSAPSESDLGVPTDAEGSFELTGVGARSGDVVVVAEGFATTSYSLDIPVDLLRPDPVVISLDVGATIRARVAGGRASERTAVTLRRGDRIVDYESVDADGWATFEHRAPGAYEVEVLGGLGDSERVVVERGDRERTVTLRAERTQD